MFDLMFGPDLLDTFCSTGAFSAVEKHRLHATLGLQNRRIPLLEANSRDVKTPKP